METIYADRQAVQVVKIAGDGNCLFAALAHQMFGGTINSWQHRQKTRILRQQATTILRENTQEYWAQLVEGTKERSPRYDELINEDGTPNEDRQVQALLQDLERDKFWGGGEAIAAISNRYRATIEVYLEQGTRITIRPGSNTESTLYIAYRLAKGTRKRNHYDSITSVMGAEEVMEKEALLAQEMRTSETHMGIRTGDKGYEVEMESFSQAPKQAEVIGNKTWMATWNVRGCSTLEKRRQIDMTLADLEISIACIQETHLATGTTNTDNYSWHHSGNQDCIPQYRGVGLLIRRNSNIQMTKFIPSGDSLGIGHLQILDKKCIIVTTHVPSATDKRMKETWTQVKQAIGRLENVYPNIPLIIAGDWNAHIGKMDLREDEKMFIGPALKHQKCNENGIQMKLLTQLFGLSIQTTWSNSKTILNTWSNGKTESQLDHILVRKKDCQLRVKHIKAMTIQEVSTDHKIIRAEIQWKSIIEKTPLQERRKKPGNKWNLERLKMPDERLNYQLHTVALRNQSTESKGSPITETEKGKFKKWEDIVGVIQQAASITLNRPSSPNTPGRRKANAAMLKAQFNYYRKPGNLEAKTNLKRARERKRKAYKEHEDRKYEAFFKNIIKLHPLQRLHQTYKLLKKNKRTNKKQHFIPIAKWQAELREQQLLHSESEIEILEEEDHWPLSRPATAAEVAVRIETWKPNSAPGLDQISAELLKAVPWELQNDIMEILTRAWVDNDIPEQWTTTIQVPIPKIPVPKTTADYRRITLCSIAYKLHAKHILKTLDDCIDPLPDYQMAFLPNRSTDDHMFTTRRILEEDWRAGKRNYVLALDLAKAFDTVKHEAIVAILKHQKVPYFLINRIIKACLYESTAILWYGQTTDFKRKKVGVKQGCPLSPRIFTLVLHEVIQTTVEVLPQFKLIENNMTAPVLLAYADDILIISEDEESIQTLLQELVPNMESVGMKLNVEKCQIMIKDPKMPQLEEHHLRHIQIGNYAFRRVQAIKYLGTILTSDLCRTDTTRPRIKKAFQAMHSLTNALGKHKLPWSLMRTLYNAIIAPTALYGIKTAAMTKANRMALRQMEREIIHRIAQKGHPFPTNHRTTTLLQGKTINKKVRVQRIRYWAHIKRRENSSTIGAALRLRAPYKKVGRPCFTWNDTLKRDMEKIPTPQDGWTETARDKLRMKKESKEFYNMVESSDSETSETGNPGEG